MTQQRRWLVPGVFAHTRFDAAGNRPHLQQFVTTGAAPRLHVAMEAGIAGANGNEVADRSRRHGIAQSANRAGTWKSHAVERNSLEEKFVVRGS